MSLDQSDGGEQALMVVSWAAVALAQHGIKCFLKDIGAGVGDSLAPQRGWWGSYAFELKGPCRLLAGPGPSLLTDRQCTVIPTHQSVVCSFIGHWGSFGRPLFNCDMVTAFILSIRTTQVVYLFWIELSLEPDLSGTRGIQ